MNKFQVLKEFLQFLKARKKWALCAVAFFLLFIGILFVSLQGSALAPFIHTLF